MAVAQSIRNICLTHAAYQDCLIEFALAKDSFACPKCPFERFRIIAGDEMTVESIEEEA
jgi:Zn finger protein HypA/HybF involved in hydrogenase expression